ncbi:glycosyltransferase [Rhizobiales bacterium RZME27]|uniref:Glycosyltransferase n=1 Tax=Endobacterium cereale TaxID=2663029 RepID=A0A6A8AGN0_9HYPH|nr:glycosyltransferase family 4 protein [Endobacterium cereale]MEB2845431.1 glycosyltransferase family 4 protein [Endobacterium cereale]MQY48940.1 glycosyltransferase [Endobacterium cereale]
MKILHVCESIIGGTGSYLAELIPHQVAAYGRENVQLLVPETHFDFIDPAIRECGAQILTFKRPTRLLGSFLLVQRYLQAVSTFQPDVVHAHSSVAGIIVRVLGLRRNYRIVFCPHGWSVDMQGARYVRGFAEMMERKLGNAADSIIVISKHEYRRAMELGLSPDKVTLVESGIDRNVPPVPSAEWKDDRIRLLYAGRFDYQKGVDILLKAVEGLGNRFSVRLVGGFAVSEENMPETLPDHIAQLGWMDRDGVYAQMKACDVLVVPSRWEGFGLVAIEAMRMQKPVVAAAVGGLVEILGNGKYGMLVPSEDPDALRDCLASLTRETLEEFGEIGRKRFLACYTSDRMVRQIDDVYVSILPSRLPEPQPV